ncbi:MAG: DMT family transporter [Proteobacteria bacterium]|nr:DMT family transporter [Candidatus Fonsibacter sp. PEL5]
MRNLVLFITTLICWSPTWYLIKFQFGIVDPLISIFYRFFIASTIVFIFLILFKKKLLFNLYQHLWFLLLGVTLFSLNYIFFYLANTYLISGIVTIAFSTILIMNILGERIYFNIKSSKQTLMAAGFGIIGILTIFEKELLNFKIQDKTHIGIILSFIATFWASTGNLIHQKNSKDKIPFIQSIAYGMFYGSIFTLIVAKFRGAELIFDYSFSYISSLLYLAIIGSVVAFYLYLKLLENIGSARAGYMGVVMPIIALIISTIFEGLQWTNNLIFGLPVLIFGCVLILNQKSKNI